MKNICTLLIAVILAMLSIAGCSSAKGGKADTNAAEAAADSTAATVAIQFSADSAPVSYTHLTLPTILLV